MKRIFWGMLLIMIDLTIMNGVFYLDLLPDFLGVLLCLWGMAQLDDVWHHLLPDHDVAHACAVQHHDAVSRR